MTAAVKTRSGNVGDKVALGISDSLQPLIQRTASRAMSSSGTN